MEHEALDEQPQRGACILPEAGLYLLDEGLVLEVPGRQDGLGLAEVVDGIAFCEAYVVEQGLGLETRDDGLIKEGHDPLGTGDRAGRKLERELDGRASMYADDVAARAERERRKAARKQAAREQAAAVRLLPMVASTVTAGGAAAKGMTAEGMSSRSVTAADRPVTPAPARSRARAAVPDAPTAPDGDGTGR